ncbi:two-component system sensor histidine kinase TctE [Inquilinus ginsengisoli]|uniref:histidine kinase n=1 Tax=Inquilinus ginsengisoli TaxID=363840 RepID=A0ABU1JWN2_9PROT|nr:sensor histidine kinase N-terminal domain-containing protein [Inquilinus ginsengisoli]MDR6293031.1 two-component system sensor histidine kinase TctE [Inquilinus ginsengisoli]
MRIKSLRLELLLWLIVPLAGVVAVNVWTTYRGAAATADLVTDRMLLASARAIAEQTRVDRGVIEALIPPVALEMFATGNQDRVYYRVQTAEGRLLTGYPDLPLATMTAEGEDPAALEQPYRDEALRLIAISHPVVGAGAASPVEVAVGVTLHSHAALARQLWLRALGQQSLLLLVAGILALIGLARGLTPLLRLRNAVQRRRPDELTPFAVDSVQTELRPLVGALNHLMERVERQMAAQRRFVANAAHQLRTPLALLNTQASYALREPAEPARTEALTALQRSAGQLAHLASQLLTLSRAAPGSRRPRHDRIDLHDLARQALEPLAGLAVERGIDLGLDGDPGIAVRGDETMLREAVVNLVENALRYVPAGGVVTVAVAAEGAMALLRVEDDGPGIPAAERDQVFERFYRILGTEGAGSGLGLAIVKEIVETAGGTVRLRDPASGHGLVAEIRLPAAEDGRD